jgi:DNA-binding transcriptional LysR family regulator
VEWVASQHVDLGIGLLAMDHPGVRFEHFLRIDGVCVLPPGHRLAARQVIDARDLREEPFISLGTEDRSRFLVDQAFERRDVRRNIVIEAQQSEAACAFVASGAGVSVVEPFSASEFDRSDLVVRRFRPAVSFDMWLLFPLYRKESLLVKGFLELLAQEIPVVVQRLLRNAGSR